MAGPGPIRIKCDVLYAGCRPEEKSRPLSNQSGWRCLAKKARKGVAFLKTLVHPKERIYFFMSLVISLLVYLFLVVSLIGIGYILIGAIIGIILHGLFVGHIRGNAIRVSQSQFPEVHRLSQQLTVEMGLDQVPAIYVLQAGGLLNAFATRFLGRSFVIIYTDVLELAYAQGEAELAFVIAHEFAHIRRKHLSLHWLLYPAYFVPFLGKAYSRACEYTCDRFAAHLRPDGAAKGLLVLAAGKNLYRRVNLEAYKNQTETEEGFWTWFSEILATHPPLPKRLRAVVGVGTPVYPDAHAAPVDALP